MAAREHHFFFAKKLIPTETFRSTDRMFAELTGPQREAFVFFLWTEAGKGMAQALPHIDLAPGGRELTKLDVVGRVAVGETEVVVLSMPPAIEANEALFVALVRKAGAASVFFYERTADLNTGAVHPKEAVLAEVRADGSRSNYGFHEGLDLQAFKSHLGKVLGISLDGLETSLPPVTAAAFVAAGGAPRAGGGQSRGGAKPGGMLETLLLVRAGLPLAMFAASYTVPSLTYGLWPVVVPLYGVLSVVIGISLLVWLYKVYDMRRGQTPFGPGMAVAGWLIPVVNFFLPPLIVRGAWKAVVGAGGGLLALIWWLAWMLEVVLQTMRSMQVHLSRGIEGGAWNVSFVGGHFSLPEPAGEALLLLWSPLGGLLCASVAYGLLWHIVRTIRAKM